MITNNHNSSDSLAWQSLPQLNMAEHKFILGKLEGFKKKYGNLNFLGNDGRDLAHSIVQYPAMMVPRMQGELIRCFYRDEQRPSIIDPFMGSGTVLVEAQRQGLSFRGIDINPYAFLIAMVKASPLSSDTLLAMPGEFDETLKADTSNALDHNFAGRDKWFSEEVARDLAKLRRVIQLIPDEDKRRLLWVCLGETVRTSSNSRTSTFKLHIRSEQERLDRLASVKALQAFSATLQKIVGLLAAERSSLPFTAKSPRLSLVDVRHACLEEPRADLLISSPPYGDNKTTVPYGQFSYLALQWIDTEDIPGTSTHMLRNTHALDTHSLGGGQRDVWQSQDELQERSSTLKAFLPCLQGQTARDGRKRVIAFYRDLDVALARCTQLVATEGYMVWTVGNRRVCNVLVPMDAILRELLEARGCKHVCDLTRIIPTKRMAVKNSVSDTMRSETVVVMQNG